MELEVVGPEAGDGGDRRARGHEREVGARQLEQRAASPPRRRALSRSSAVGQRLPARAPAADGDIDAGGAQDRRDERGRRRLAGGAGDPDRRPGPTLEQQVAETRDARALRAKPLYAGRDLGRPDVEVGDLGRPRVGVEIGVGPRRGCRAREGAAASSGAAAALARRTVRPSSARPPRERERVGVEPLDENRHPMIIWGAPPSPRGRRPCGPSASAGTRGRPCSSPGRASGS